MLLSLSCHNELEVDTEKDGIENSVNDVGYDENVNMLLRAR